jgi:hypothetical protein
MNEHNTDDIIWQLLEAGASVRETIREKTVAIKYRRRNFLKFLQILEAEKFGDWNIPTSGVSVLPLAVTCEEPERALQLISRNGGNIAAISSDGKNGIHYAIYRTC